MKRTSCQQSVISNQDRLCRKATASTISSFISMSSIARRAEEDHYSSLERKQSFTLIELLVVIAIIAILAGMLLPALKSARDQAHTAACINRQKQFGQIFMLYADSYKEWSIGSPYPGHLPAVNSSKQAKWWTLFAKGNDNAAGTTCFDTAQGKREKMLTCPTAKGSGKMDKTQVSDGSYSINQYLAQKQSGRGRYDWANQGAADGNNNNKPSFFKPTTVPKPFNLFWLQCTASYCHQNFFFWHSGTTPMLFVDLSVKRLKRGDVAPYSGEYKAIWCYYPASGSSGKTSL